MTELRTMHVCLQHTGLLRIGRLQPWRLPAAVGLHDVCNAIAQGHIHAPHVGAVGLRLIKHLLHALSDDISNMMKAAGDM